MEERRGAKRFRRELPVSFYTEDESFQGVSSDFSANGIFIITNNPLKPGTRIKITLEVSKKEKIRLKGVVIRSINTGDINIRNGMGIKLSEIPFIYHNFLNRLG